MAFRRASRSRLVRRMRAPRLSYRSRAFSRAPVRRRRF